MKTLNIFILTTISFMLGCGTGQEPEGVIPQHQLKALEKAKNVENMLLDAEQERRKKIDNSSL